MADEVDLAQANHESFVEQRILARKKEHEARLRDLPMCSSCEERRVFVTDKGTIARICRQCHEEDSTPLPVQLIAEPA